MTQAQLFDGTVLEFPDGTSTDVIQRVVREQTAARKGAAGTDTGAGEWTPPAPPPGEIIHGAGGQSYISDNPSVNATLPGDASPEQQDVAMRALKLRGETEGIVPKVARPFIPLRQGMTFNFGDELTSLIFGGVKAATGGDFSNAYNFSQEFQRQELDRQRGEAPIASAATEMLGGTMSGLGLAKSGVTITGRMANEGLSNLVPRMVAGAVEGAGYGALAGAGGGSGVDERLANAKDNLLLGAGVGAAAVPAVDLLGAIAGKVADVYRGIRDPEAQGQQLLVRSMARDNTTPGALADSVDDAAKAGQPDYRAVDAAGKNTQRVGAMAAKTPSAFRDTAADALAARQNAQGQRIGDYVDQALGAHGPDAYATEQGITQARKAAAGPLYEAAFKAPPPSGKFYTETAARQSVKDAMRAAERTAAEKQVPITELFQEVPNPNPQTRQIPSSVLGPDGRPVMQTEVVDPTIRVPTVRGWDFIKKELDAKVNQLYQAGDTTAAEAVKETRNALRAQLAADVPEYGQALAKYADDTSSIEAIQAGRDLVKARNADEAKAAFGAVDPGKKDLAKIGAAREIGVNLENARSGQDKTLMFDTPNMRGKLDVLAEDPIARMLLEERIGRERDMVRAGRTMLGGSSTYENALDGADNVSGGALASLFTGNITNAIGKGAGYLLGGLARRAAGMSEGAANTAGDYLMSNDPNKIRSLADLFAEYMAARNAPSLAPSAIAAGMNAPRDGQVGR